MHKKQKENEKKLFGLFDTEWNSLHSIPFIDQTGNLILHGTLQPQNKKPLQNVSESTKNARCARPGPRNLAGTFLERIAKSTLLPRPGHKTRKPRTPEDQKKFRKSHYLLIANPVRGFGGASKIGGEADSLSEASLSSIWYSNFLSLLFSTLERRSHT